MFWIKPPVKKVRDYANNPINFAQAVTFYPALLSVDWKKEDSLTNIPLIRFETNHKASFWYFPSLEARDEAIHWLQNYCARPWVANEWTRKNGYDWHIDLEED